MRNLPRVDRKRNNRCQLGRYHSLRNRVQASARISCQRQNKLDLESVCKDISIFRLRSRTSRKGCWLERD
jgi:hypothetical protein